MHTKLKQIIYLPNSLGGQQKNKQQQKKTTKRNTDELQMVSETEVAVPLLLSFHPQAGKLEKALRAGFSFNVGTD